LRWAAESLGSAWRITSVRRLNEGCWHAMHALTVVDRGGQRHRLVLRRWANPEWRTDDPDFTPEREANALEVLSRAPIPTPVLLAADPEPSVCDVPTLLLTHLPGRAPGLPRDMDSFSRSLPRP
jgi:hypothetical protein